MSDMFTSEGLAIRSDAVCRQCAYPLRGLAEARCPECGRPFDPAVASTYRLPREGWDFRAFGRRHLAGLLLAAALLMMWAEEAVCFAGVLGVPLAVASLIVSAKRRRWGKVALVVALSPYTIHAGAGVGSYFAGQPHIRLLTVRGADAWSIDPVYRCRQGSTSCCLIAGNFWTAACHDAAIKLCIKMFGYPPGAYTGPYPTRAQAAAALATGTVVPYQEGADRLLDVKGEKIWMSAINSPVCWRLSDRPSAEIRWAVVEQRCLVVGGRTTLEAAPLQDIVLIDLTTQLPFAWYRDVGVVAPPP